MIAVIRHVPIALFGGISLLGLVMMTVSYVSNPPVASTFLEAYGQTYTDELRFILLVSAAEIAVVMLVLRPWSYNMSWVRALIALALLTPWMVFWFAAGLHAGPTTHMHTMWLFLLWVALIISAAVSLVGWIRTSRQHHVHADRGR